MAVTSSDGANAKIDLDDSLSTLKVGEVQFRASASRNFHPLSPLQRATLWCAGVSGPLTLDPDAERCNASTLSDEIWPHTIPDLFGSCDEMSDCGSVGSYERWPCDDSSVDSLGFARAWTEDVFRGERDK